MNQLQQNFDEYRIQMEKGILPQAYKGLMEYILSLRTHFANRYPHFSVPGSIYFGYMDMTYFSLLPEELKARKLKIAVVFIHATCRFEVWLSAVNKQVQARYWEFFKQSGWGKYHLVPAIQGADSILEQVLDDHPDFSDLDALTKKIESGTVDFIDNVISFLNKSGQ
jgi:hypothetical protein